MTNIILLSSKDYEPYGPNYGDCIIIDTGTGLVIYDCGCEEHAKRVEEYMLLHNYSQAIGILSHNDSDHFKGFEYLVEKQLLSKIYAQLFLKHKADINKLLDDGRVTNKSLGDRITKDYNNIASLSGDVELVDAIELGEIVPGVEIVGPDKDYAITVVTKELDNGEGDTIDAETAYNAASVQVSVQLTGKKVLLCGDASFESVKDKLNDYKVIQLPHHGKADTAELIFSEKKFEFATVYLVSDNTGETNGGSDKLNKVGRQIFNTLNGDITYPDNSQGTLKVGRVLGITGTGWSYR